MRTLLLLLGFLTGIKNLTACNTREHHSVLSHYNHAQQVFEGRVIGFVNVQKRFYQNKHLSKSTLNRLGKLVKFEITKNYKEAAVKTVIIIGIPTTQPANFVWGKDYLVYANQSLDYTCLITEQAFPLQDKKVLQQHHFLTTLEEKYTGRVVEYAASGKKWAEGRMENGLPVGVWRYYAMSGELMIEGHYEAGEEVGEWTYFQHTTDANYKIFDQIIKGNYYQETGTYLLLALDSSTTKPFRYQITYLVGQDTLQEYFGYNQQHCIKKVSYQEGWRHGKESSFSLDGTCLSFYHFDNGRLEGAFWEKQPLASATQGHLEVKGTYHGDKKQNEQHFYYENNLLIRQKWIMRKGKLVL